MIDLLGMLAMAGAQNPDLFAQAMASQGISPTQMGAPGIAVGQMPGNMTPAPNPLDGLGGSLGSMLAGPVADPTLGPMSNGTTPSVAGPAGGILQALQAVKAPQAPAPIMNAGVSGSQKAPELSTKASGSNVNSQILQMLMSLGAGGQASSAPTLGSLLKGV